MRTWPAELAARLGNAPPIGLHFFVWRNLPSPRTSASLKLDEDFNFLDGEGVLIRCRMEEPSWDEFQEANEGRVAQAIGGWENMGQVAWGHGPFPFLWARNLSETCRQIRDILKKADETISAYLCLPGPSILAWRFYKGIRDYYGCGSDEYFRLLGLISLSQGYDYDDIAILARDENNWPTRGFEPFDQAFIHEPTNGVRFPIDVYAVQDFVAAFKEAVNEWVPEELINTSLEIEAEESLPPVEGGEPAYLFRRKRRVAHAIPRH